jgi:hypothetical protein
MNVRANARKDGEIVFENKFIRNKMHDYFLNNLNLFYRCKFRNFFESSKSTDEREQYYMYKVKNISESWVIFTKIGFFPLICPITKQKLTTQ